MERKDTMDSRPTRISLVIAGLVSVLALGIGLGAAAFAVLGDEPTTVVRQVTIADSEPAAAGDALTIGEIYARASKAVVEITGTSGGSSFGDPARRCPRIRLRLRPQRPCRDKPPRGRGGGAISVSLWNGRTFDAVLVGADPSTDVAVYGSRHPNRSSRRSVLRTRATSRSETQCSPSGARSASKEP